MQRMKGNLSSLTILRFRFGPCLMLLLFQVWATPTRADDATLFPDELVKFVAEAPIVFDGDAKSWDKKIRERGWILREGTQYRLWYTGYDGSKTGIRRLGYATSQDGVRWERQSHEPMLPELWVEDMMVLKVGGTYWMFAEGARDRAHLLSSTDGMHWKPLGPLDIRYVNGTPIMDGPYGTPTAWFEHDRWYLFYERMDRGVWLATSTDMQVWTHVQDEPVMVPGPDAYDRDMIAFNQIIKHGGRYYVYYHGSATAQPGQPTLWNTCIATSTDLVHWHKYPGNPLLPTANNQSSGIVVERSGRWQLFTMHPEVHLHDALAP
ncbi:MAG: glycosylase [Planctomycetales bacterium]|nr:glycosylase [Planctomycetales bacterium]